MNIAKPNTEVKVPGESVRNKPLHDSKGKVIGTIVDVVYSPDYKMIDHGIVELDKEFAGGVIRRDIAWDAVRFDDHGKASLTDEAGEDLLSIPVGASKAKTRAEKETQEAAEVDFFDNRQRPV